MPQKVLEPEAVILRLRRSQLILHGISRNIGDSDPGESTLAHTIRPLSTPWNRGVAIQISRDATGNPDVPIGTSLEDAGLSSAELRRGYRKDVQSRVKDWNRKVPLDAIKANASTKVREVGDSVFENATLEG